MVFGFTTTYAISSSVHKDVTEGRTDGRKDGSVTISLRNFVGEEIINSLPKGTVNYNLMFP
jgi:hypothetical protein